MDNRFIRNFSIIAHIDHGKSTLADRFIELTNSISTREMTNQFLDNMDLEKERGITIKAQTVRLKHKGKDGQLYYFNLIDTPGHVDFTYEVSRSLASCEGALLVVDASQGVEAQTLANVYLAIENNLEIIPVLNKIDLPHADVDKAAGEIRDIVGLDIENISKVSAKSGLGVLELLDKVIEKVPAPSGKVTNPLQALIFDSWFDAYRGVVILVRVFEGKISLKDKIYLKKSDREFEVLEMAVHEPFYSKVEEMGAGEVGILICGIKTIRDVHIGDTVVHAHQKETNALKGYKDVKAMVFCGIFPVETEAYQELKDALEKLALNDASFTYEPETSQALGFGFRCGFLGLLHMNIIQERLEREFNLNLISTAPSVSYKVKSATGEETFVDNPSKLPDISELEELCEPFVELSIHLPNEYLGKIIKLCEDRRGKQLNINYITPERVQLVYDLPLSEMVFDFYDHLKSLSKGYASMDYDFKEYRPSDLVKLDILLNSEKVDALSIICHRDSAYLKGRDLTHKLSKIIERQQFEIAIQASIGAKVIARESVRALRKNVLAKCYGGDISRKRKLLEKQKEGKKRMKMVGNVELPQEAFLAVLKVDE